RTITRRRNCRARLWATTANWPRSSAFRRWPYRAVFPATACRSDLNFSACHSPKRLCSRRRMTSNSPQKSAGLRRLHRHYQNELGWQGRPPRLYVGERWQAAVLPQATCWGSSPRRPPSPSRGSWLRDAAGADWGLSSAADVIEVLILTPLSI